MDTIGLGGTTIQPKSATIHLSVFVDSQYPGGAVFPGTVLLDIRLIGLMNESGVSVPVGLSFLEVSEAGDATRSKSIGPTDP